VRQRQPHRADLLPSGCQAVENTAGDDQVGARVIVGQREAELEVMNGGECAGERDAGGDGDRDSTVSVQGAP
jgi:hypothetical protein